ncbi:MAG TPA: response regulator [Blastocatellia bacterium]|jgi:CheY-like chemotaxis protein|nr:response regulator [Blastocatellia bacterium]
MTRKKILLVDDADTVLMIEQLILRTDYDLVTARNGEDAVAMALTERPDLILLDVVMPIMDGFAACKQIRENEQISSIPVIMVTTRGEERNLERGFQNGCTEYVTKPINRLELITKVQNCLGE